MNSQYFNGMFSYDGIGIDEPVDYMRENLVIHSVGEQMIGEELQLLQQAGAGGSIR